MRPYLLTLLITVLPPGAACAGTTYHQDAATGLETWETDADGVNVRLTQIGTDQAVAFFLGRGFPEDAARDYARACVFMTVVRNTGTQPIEHDLGGWTIRQELGPPGKPRLKEDWAAEWARRGLGQGARIGFEWSQFPTRQRFEPGDWNQGMTTYLVAPGVRFDVLYNWRRAGTLHAGRLEGVRCASSNERR